MRGRLGRVRFRGRDRAQLGWAVRSPQAEAEQEEAAGDRERRERGGAGGQREREQREHAGREGREVTQTSADQGKLTAARPSLRAMDGTGAGHGEEAGLPT